MDGTTENSENTSSEKSLPRKERTHIAHQTIENSVAILPPQLQEVVKRFAAEIENRRLESGKTYVTSVFTEILTQFYFEMQKAFDALPEHPQYEADAGSIGELDPIHRVEEDRQRTIKYITGILGAIEDMVKTLNNRIAEL